MSGPALFGTRQFRAEREADWQRLETMLKRVERGWPGRLDDADLIELPRLYRATLSALSVARETSLDAGMIAYLEGLSSRAYFVLYGVREPWPRQLRRFFASGLPAAVRAILPETLVIAALFLASAIAAYFLVLADPAWFNAILPESYAQGRNLNATPEFLRGTLYDPPREGGLEIFATYLFTHNSQVAILAFALGFAFGIPTFFLIAQNGALLGAFAAVYIPKGLGTGMFGWLMIHGSTELFAIILAGAAGLHIGRAIAFPGDRARLAAAGDAGRRAASVMMGVVLMLLIAGLLEGFGRQLIRVDAARFAIAAAMFAIWTGWFYLAGRTRHG